MFYFWILIYDSSWSLLSSHKFLSHFIGIGKCSFNFSELVSFQDLNLWEPYCIFYNSCMHSWNSQLSLSISRSFSNQNNNINKHMQIAPYCVSFQSTGETSAFYWVQKVRRWEIFWFSNEWSFVKWLPKISNFHEEPQFIFLKEHFYMTM